VIRDYYFFRLAQVMPLCSPQGFNGIADSKYIKCLGIYVNKLKLIIKHYPRFYLYLQNDLLFLLQ